MSNFNPKDLNEYDDDMSLDDIEKLISSLKSRGMTYDDLYDVLARLAQEVNALKQVLKDSTSVDY